jgi:hypothetical protein
MHRCRPLAVLAACLLWPAPPVMAEGLAWDKTCVEVTAHPGQRLVNVDFNFRNRGDRVVTLVSIETSCRCLSAEATPMACGPGENGKVEVSLTVGKEHGRQERSVTVTTDEPDAKPVRLVLLVDIAGAPGTAIPFRAGDKGR